MGNSETVPDSNEKYRSRLQADFPGLVIQDLKTIGNGWDHVALEVNESLIFRIPRGVYNMDKLSKTVAYETEILRYLQGKLPVDIPNPTYIAPNDAYFGYPKLAGEIMIDIWSNFNEAEKADFWDEWVEIVVAIHETLPVETARKIGVPDLEIHLETSKEIFSLIGVEPQVLDFAAKSIEAAEAIDLTRLKPLFIQNDLQLHNMLANAQTKKVTGVIDWTDACVGPIERELSSWEWYHDDQLQEVASRYERKTGNGVDIQLAKVFKHVEEVTDYVEQVKSGESKGANDSLNHIHKWIAEAK